MKTVNLMFDGVSKECLVTTDKNGETVCFAKDGQFVKFPAKANLTSAVKAHNDANDKKPLPPEESAQDLELKKWLGKK